jgi:hypothetical protein
MLVAGGVSYYTIVHLYMSLLRLLCSDGGKCDRRDFSVMPENPRRFSKISVRCALDAKSACLPYRYAGMATAGWSEGRYYYSGVGTNGYFSVQPWTKWFHAK